MRPFPAAGHQPASARTQQWQGHRLQPTELLSGFQVPGSDTQRTWLFFFPSGISQTNSSHNSNNKQPSYYNHFVLGAPPDRRQGLHLFITSSQLCAPISHTALAAALQGWRIPSVHSSGTGRTRSCSPCMELCLHTHCCHQGDAPLAINSRTRAHPHPFVAQFAMKWQTVHKLKANAEELGIFSKLGTTVNNWAVSRTLISLIPYTEATV